MEISNLVAENLSFSALTANFSTMSAGSNDHIPWSDSKFARGKIGSLRNLYATSTLASDNDCSFEDTIASLRLML